MNDARMMGIGMTSQRTRERMIQRLRESGITSESVLGVMSTTPRHIFVDEALASRAYEDTALPIGFGQTISQPLTVARMSELLFAEGRIKTVLEIGTGSGYQTAVLAQLADQVLTVERIRGLSQRARQRLSELRLHNVRFKYDDGNSGWSEPGPFAGIIVTAVANELPPALLAQLALGGRLVIPTGSGTTQVLRLIIRTEDGYSDQLIDRVQFVPMRAGLRG